MKYVVYFDDGYMLGEPGPGRPYGKFVREFPDAKQFTNKRTAEQTAAHYSAPSTVEAIEED